MIREKQRIKAKILAFIVIIAGITVIIGWLFNISVLKNIFPAWVSMKFAAAIAFVLSGITLYFIARALEGEFDKAQVALSITSLIILLLMGILFFSALFGINTGIENIFIKEPAGTVKTLSPGRPSLLTIINFMLIALAGILTLVNTRKLQSKLKFIGLLVGLIGAVAVAGYIINAQVLYYYIKGLNSAMACHTAILFVILGIGLLCL